MTDSPVKNIGEYLEKEAKAWVESHKASLGKLAKADAEAVVIASFLAAVPDDLTSPSLNIRKMQYAGKLAEIARVHQVNLDALEAEIKERVKVILKEVVKRVSSYFMSVIIPAVL